MDIAQSGIEFSIIHYGLLLFGSFLATLTGSLLGLGGGFIILGLLALLLPVTVMIPVLAGVLACIDLNRAFAFRSHLHTPIFYPFVLGCVVGVSAGAMLFISLPDRALGTGLALLILLSMAYPAGRVRWQLKYPFLWIGTLHSFFSTMFGYGGVFQAAMLQTTLGNLQITATLATSFLVLELMKIGSYAMGGFDYQPYLGIVVAAACGALPASLIGRRMAHKVTTTFYRTAQKVIVGLIAINILAKTWM